ncbi:MAG: hypothetical protein H6711_31455 [Myxococcales bacterium]|nr:hypothetical protein [Myxococcales bacterium]
MKNLTVRLGRNDWDRDQGGWRCSALHFEGAVVEELRFDGTVQDPKLYTVDEKHSLIRWSSADPPREVLASIALTKDLVSSRWKQLAIYVPVLVAMIGAASTIVAARIETGDASAEPETKQDVPDADDSAAPMCSGESFGLQVATRGVLRQVAPAILEFNPDGIETEEEAMAAFLWQVKSQGGFAEFLSGGSAMSVQLTCSDDSVKFDWRERHQNILSRIGDAAVGRAPTDEELRQWNAEMNLLGVAWLSDKDYVVRGGGGGLSLIGPSGT